MSTARYSFPVIGAEGDTNLRARRLFGTAFPLAGSYFMSAAHVLKAVHESNLTPCLGYKEEDYLNLSRIRGTEYFETVDTAICESIVPEKAKLLWVRQECSLLQEVYCSGFPHSLDLEIRRLQARSLQGYIVSQKRSHRFEAKPRAYELSIQCPRGLSGAALFSWAPKTKIAGMIVGNSTTEIPVYKTREVIDEKTTTVVERYEATHYGLAIRTTELLSLNSDLIGSSLNDFLKSLDRIVEPQ